MFQAVLNHIDIPNSRGTRAMYSQDLFWGSSSDRRTCQISEKKKKSGDETGIDSVGKGVHI